MVSRTCSFGFSVGCKGRFCLEDLDVRKGGCLQYVQEEALGMASGSKAGLGDGILGSLVAEFTTLFSPTLGTA